MLKFLGKLLGKKELAEEKLEKTSKSGEKTGEDEEKKLILQELGSLEKEEAAALPAMQEEPKEEANGTVAVISGEVKITSPKEGGIPARIQPGRGVEILINGQEIKKVTPVIEGDVVELIVVNQEPVRQVEVEITPDKMKASLVIVLEKGIKSAIIDCEPSPRILIEAKVESIVPQSIVLEEALQALKKARVVYGIDHSAVEKALDTSKGKPVLIAEGKPFALGKDAYIEYLFEQGDPKIVPSVETGELVAIKHLPEPGEDGTNVLGETISAPPVKDCELKIENGLVLENGLKARATESGRPIVGKNGLYIDPIHTIKDDVVLDKGPLIFKGHLVITGSVYEGVAIETLGDLEIKGGVHQARLLVGGKLVIQKSLIDSEVCSGRFRLIYDSIVAKLHKMNSQTNDLLDAAMQLRAKILAGTATAITEEKIINILLSSRFPELFKILKQVQLEIDPIQKYLSEELLGNLEKIFTYQKNPPEKISDLPKFYQDVNNVIKALGNYFANTTGDIVVGYVQNSQVSSSGSIYINGTGCYNSNLQSHGEVKVDGSPGVVRGGKILARDNIFVQQLGCPLGSPTQVEAPADKKVEAALIHPGVVIKLGDKVYRNDNLSKAFDVYLDSEGSLQVTKLKGE